MSALSKLPRLNALVYHLLPALAQQEIQLRSLPLDESMPGDVLKYRLERQFLAIDSSLDDRVVDVAQQVAALNAVDCADIIAQLLTYFDAYVRQLKVKVCCVPYALEII